jgi:putative ABC transport system permease protein
VIDILISAVSLGILWAVMAIGVFLTFRILDIADLSCEGVFPLGAAVAAKIISQNGDPFVACLAAIGAGILAGFATGFLHTKLKIPILLSGILSMTALYSINLRVMGKANISLLRMDTVYTKIGNVLGTGAKASTIIVGFAFVIVVVLLFWLFLNTELGYSIRATGNNVYMIRAMGVDTDKMFMFGLVLGNAMIGLAGALIAQNQSYADIGMGTGTIVIGLASVIIGEVLFGRRNVFQHMVSIVLGSISYRIIISLVLEIDFELKIANLTIPISVEPTDLKLFTSIIVAIALSLPVIKQTFAGNKAAKATKS